MIEIVRPSDFTCLPFATLLNGTLVTATKASSRIVPSAKPCRMLSETRGYQE